MKYSYGAEVKQVSFESFEYFYIYVIYLLFLQESLSKDLHADNKLRAPSIVELNGALSNYLYQGDIGLNDEQLDYFLKR